MRSRSAWVAAGLCLLAGACDKTEPPPAEPKLGTPSASASTAATESAPSATAAPVDSAAPKAKAPTTALERVTRLELTKLERAEGGWRGQLEGGAAVGVVLATKAAPLSAQAGAAHFGVASLVAPDVVPPTALRSLSLGSLSRAADAPTRRVLGEQARVLNDGTVQCTLQLTPTVKLSRVDLGDLAEGRPGLRLEARLTTKDAPPAEELTLLSRYQGLLVVDALVLNLARREVRLDREASVLLALDDNEVFSAAGRPGAVGDAFNRLARHLVYSRSVTDRLRRLSREALEVALTPNGGTLLVTPKQVDEILDRRRALLRTIDQRIKQRGEDGALALP